MLLSLMGMIPVRPHQRASVGQGSTLELGVWVSPRYVAAAAPAHRTTHQVPAGNSTWRSPLRHKIAPAFTPKLTSHLPKAARHQRLERVEVAYSVREARAKLPWFESRVMAEPVWRTDGSRPHKPVSKSMRPCDLCFSQ